MPVTVIFENPSPPASPAPAVIGRKDAIASTSTSEPSTSRDVKPRVQEMVSPLPAATKNEPENGEEAIAEASTGARRKKITIKKEPPDIIKIELDPEEASIQQEIAASSGFENDYYCKHCQSHTNSEYTYRMHLSGKKHRKRLQLLADTSDATESVTVPPKGNIREIRAGGKKCVVATRTKKNATPRIQRVLDDCKLPLVGMEYVTENWPLDETKTELSYHCSLCPADCHVNTVVEHLIGFKHRFAYIKMKDPALYAKLSVSTQKKSKLGDIVAYHARNLEEEHGRKRLIVEVSVEESVEDDDGSDHEENLPLPSAPDYTEEELNAANEEVKAMNPSELLEYLTELNTDIFQEEFALENISRSDTDACESTAYANMLKAFNDAKFNSTSPRHVEHIIRQLIAGDSAPYREFYNIPATTMGSIMRPVVERMIQDGKIDFDLEDDVK